MIIYRFQVIPTSRDPSLAIFMLLKPMAYLVYHTLKRHGMYTGGKLNPVPFDEKSLTDKSQCKKNSETKESTLCVSFKTNGRTLKREFECPIHGIINSGKIEGG